MLDLDTRIYVNHGPMGIALTLAQKHTDQARKKYVISSAKLKRENFGFGRKLFSELRNAEENASTYALKLIIFNK